MNDDWRLQIDLHEERHAHALSERLDAEQLEHDMSAAFHDRVIVSRDGAREFLYAGAREQAEAVRSAVEANAQQHGWTLDLELRHRHPAAEDWEKPDKPLPGDDTASLAERQAQCRASSKRRPEVAAQNARSASIPPRATTRFAFLSSSARRAYRRSIAGSSSWSLPPTRTRAKDLADRNRGAAPSGSLVKVEGTWGAAYAERPPNPFAVLDGLAG